MFKKSEVLKAIETQFKKDFAAGLGLIKQIGRAHV